MAPLRYCARIPNLEAVVANLPDINERRSKSELLAVREPGTIFHVPHSLRVTVNLNNMSFKGLETRWGNPRNTWLEDFQKRSCGGATWC